MELWIADIVAPLGLTLVLRPFAIAALFVVFGVFAFLVWCALREAYAPPHSTADRRLTPARPAPPRT